MIMIIEHIAYGNCECPSLAHLHLEYTVQQMYNFTIEGVIVYLDMLLFGQILW